jgi:hypothetical protein
MSQFQVTPEEVAAAGSAVGRSGTDLDGAASAVRSTAGAAAGTPVEGVYDSLLSRAGHVTETLRTAVEDLSRALGQAAANYTRTEESNTACFAPGARR